MRHDSRCPKPPRLIDWSEAGTAPESAYGPQHVEQWRQRWRIFLMACADGVDAAPEPAHV